MADLLSSLPIVGGFFDTTGDAAMAELAKNQALYGMALPDLLEYRPDVYSYEGDYAPKLAEAQTYSEDPRLRGYQLASLARQEQLAQNGLSAEDLLAFERARRSAESVAKSGAQSALQNAQARGVAGSGLEFAMREQAAQGASNRAQESALEQAAASARQRALYEQALMQGTGQMRAQDLGVGQTNMNAINAFNQLNTGAMNQAAQRNLEARQGINNANVDTRNQAQLQNNAIKQQQFANQLSKATGQANANTGMAQGYYAQNAANTAQRDQFTRLAALGLGAGLSGGGFGDALMGYGGYNPNKK